MYEVPGTVWQFKSWPKPLEKLKSMSPLSKTIRYKSVFAKSDFENAIKNNKKEVA